MSHQDDVDLKFYYPGGKFKHEPAHLLEFFIGNAYN